jgi:hypothetical protein
LCIAKGLVAKVGAAGHQWPGKRFAFRQLLGAKVVAGCPSCGGQRTVGSHSAATVGAGSLRCAVLMRSNPSRSIASSRQVGSLALEPAEYGLPNPAFQRTAFGSR